MKDLPTAELDSLMAHFFMKIKTKKNEDYEPNSLSSFQCSFDRHLRNCDRKLNIFKDAEFAKSRASLVARRKELRRKGKGRRPNKAEALSSSDVDKLWESGEFGDHSPRSLVQIVWFNFTMYFGWRARNEHYKLKFGDLDVRKDENGDEEYVIWLTKRGSKTRTGETETVPERLFDPGMFSADGPRCPVKMFKAFLAHRPKQMNKPEDPFYLLCINRPTSDIWCKCQRIGINSSGNLMKTMSAAAGLEGKRFVNHSGRKTVIETLLHAGIDYLQTARLTGHKNPKCLDDYTSASFAQQKEMSMLVNAKHNANGTSHSTNQLQFSIQMQTVGNLRARQATKTHQPSARSQMDCLQIQHLQTAI